MPTPTPTTTFPVTLTHPTDCPVVSFSHSGPPHRQDCWITNIGNATNLLDKCCGPLAAYGLYRDAGKTDCLAYCDLGETAGPKVLDRVHHCLLSGINSVRMYEHGIYYDIYYGCSNPENLVSGEKEKAWKVKMGVLVMAVLVAMGVVI